MECVGVEVGWWGRKDKLINNWLQILGGSTEDSYGEDVGDRVRDIDWVGNKLEIDITGWHWGLWFGLDCWVMINWSLTGIWSRCESICSSL